MLNRFKFFKLTYYLISATTIYSCVTIASSLNIESKTMDISNSDQKLMIHMYGVINSHGVRKSVFGFFDLNVTESELSKFISRSTNFSETENSTDSEFYHKRSYNDNSVVIESYLKAFQAGKIDLSASDIDQMYNEDAQLEKSRTLNMSILDGSGRVLVHLGAFDASEYKGEKGKLPLNKHFPNLDIISNLSGGKIFEIRRLYSNKEHSIDPRLIFDFFAKVLFITESSDAELLFYTDKSRVRLYTTKRYNFKTLFDPKQTKNTLYIMKTSARQLYQRLKCVNIFN